MGRAALMLAAALVAAVPVVVVPRPAAADAGARARQRLKDGRKLYEDQEYRKAARELAPVARDPAATRAQKLEALELLALCWFILGDEEQARDAFEDLLAIDAGYELQEPSGSPKIKKFFAYVKEAYLPGEQPEKAITIEHAAPVGATAGRRVELQLDVTAGADLVRTVTVKWRRRGLIEYQETAMRNVKGARWRARFTLPADRAGYVLEYFIEARDVAGRLLGRAGGPETPIALAARGAIPDDDAWYKRWYVWAGAGAVVVGSAVIFFAATAEEAPEGSLPPGTVDLSR